MFLTKISEKSTALAQALAMKGKSNELLAAINKLENPSNRTEILLYVAKGMRKANKSAEANQALDDALASSRADSKGSIRVSDLISVTEEMIKAGRIEEAKQPADEILVAVRNRYISALDIDTVIYILTKVGKTNDARKLLSEYIAETQKYKSTNDLMSSDRELSTIAKATVYLDTKKALALAGDITIGMERDRTIGGIARNLLNIGNMDEAIEILQTKSKSISSDISTSILIKLIVDRQMDKALSIIDKLFGKDSSWNTYMLGEAIKEVVNQGKIQEAMIVFCNKNDLLTTRPSCISEILIDYDKINAALTAAHNIEGNQYRSIALATVAAALAKSGKDEEAQHTLDEALSAADIRWNRYWSTMFREFSHSLSEAGKLKTAIDSAHRIVNDESRLEALTIIANEMIAVDKFEDAKEILKEILSNLDKIKDTQARTRLIPLTVNLLAQTGLTDEATQNIEEAVAVTPEKERESLREYIKFNIINGLARSGKPDEAKEAFQKAIAEKVDPTDSDYFSAFALALARTGDIDSAFEIARQAKVNTRGGSDVQYEILTLLSTEMAKSGKLADAMKAAREISNMDHQSVAILSIVKQLVKAGKTTEAVSVAGEIKSAFDRSRAFAVAAQGFASLRSFRLARLTADNCSSPADKLGVYTAILLENAKAQYPRLQTKLDAMKAKSMKDKDDEDDEDE